MIIVLAVITAFVSLPFIHVDDGVRSQGLIRPVAEMIPLLAPISGSIVLLHAAENTYVQRNDVVAHIDTNSLREIISVVPQKLDLFAGNVVDNIAVGEFNPDMGKIAGICKKLGILSFIEELPNGFETYFGENGATLSGGQKQRIAIARALYKEQEILILDEATSPLDSASEHCVQDAVNYLRSQDKTVILIAHRLSTVLLADVICVLEKGALVEEGNHQDLLKKKEHYYHLWRNQYPVSFIDKKLG